VQPTVINVRYQKESIVNEIMVLDITAPKFYCNKWRFSPNQSHHLLSITKIQYPRVLALLRPLKNVRFHRLQLWDVKDEAVLFDVQVDRDVQGMKQTSDYHFVTFKAKEVQFRSLTTGLVEVAHRFPKELVSVHIAFMLVHFKGGALESWTCR
jgi:hypothetical protein